MLLFGSYQLSGGFSLIFLIPLLPIHYGGKILSGRLLVSSYHGDTLLGWELNLYM